MRHSSIALSVLLVFAGCRRAEVTHYQTRKGADATLAAAPGPMMGGDAPSDLAPPSQLASGGLTWTLPKGWTQSAGSGMRYATIKPAIPGVDVSIVVLSGPAGGELANVNRWRGQLGLPPVDANALASARSTVPAKAGPLSVYEFSSEGEKKTRMVAALLEAEGSTWFVKMLGDEAKVASARSDFNHLLRSLRFDAAN
jgi:hypothetical protein